MRASFVQTLVYYDGPVLALLQNRKGTPVLALAIQDEIEGYEAPYLAKPTGERALNDYIDQKVDLHYVMGLTRGGGPYIFDWENFDDEVMMVPAETVVEDISEFLPLPGFFARNHTQPFSNIVSSILVSKSYKIDGRWSAKDFSQFYSKLDDLYSLFSYIKEMQDNKGALRKSLKEKIDKYPWQRGGSYLGFFRDIRSDAREEYPLRVSKIAYASPGEIEVKGVGESLEMINTLVEIFDHGQEDLSRTHKELRGILERDGVLGTDDKAFSAEWLKKAAEERADILLAGMAIEDPNTIKIACDGHIVTYSKIALAVYRRGAEFHKFHAEGRMRLPD